jgi:hypothetical protein
MDDGSKYFQTPIELMGLNSDGRIAMETCQVK